MLRICVCSAIPGRDLSSGGKLREIAHNMLYWALRDLSVKDPAVFTRLQLVSEHLPAEVCRVKRSAVTLIGGLSLQCRYRFSIIFDWLFW